MFTMLNGPQWLIKNTCSNYEIYTLLFKAFDEHKPVVFHISNEFGASSRPIEKISHHIWLTTNKKLNKEIGERDYQALLAQYAKMNKDNTNFKHIFWTNDESLIPTTIKKLQNLGNVEVRNIDSIQTEVSYLDLLKHKLENGVYGMVIDAIKYEVVRIFGGIMLDINYNITTNNNLIQVLDAYSFITSGNIDGRKVTFENSIIAASKNHVILRDICKSMHDNLHSGLDKKFSGFGKKYEYDNTIQTDLFYRLFSVSVLKHLNPYDEQAPEEIINKEGRADSPAEELIGRDMHAETWKDHI